MNEPLLIGNSLALLVGAHELARRGRRLTLLSDGKPLGGHFAGMLIDGQGFDIGMVMLEKHTPARPGADLRGYDPGQRNDWTRFGDHAARWLDEQLELRRVPTPACLLQGVAVPDFLIANRLDALAGAGVPPPAALPAGDPRHASHKGDAAVYDEMTYAEAAALNHGPALHERFIEPFVRKLLGVSSEAFLARYHRAAWVPLFYPETLAKALKGEPAGLAEYPFWTTHNGFVGQLVKDLRERLAGMPNVTLATQPLRSLRREGARWTAEVEGAAAFGGERLALGLVPERAQALLGTAPTAPGAAASVSVLFASVRADAIGRAHGCLMVLDEDHAAYRLSDQDALAGLAPERHRVTIEAAPDRLAAMYPTLGAEAALRQELARLMGVPAGDEDAVRVLKCITAHNALALPTAAQVAKLEAAHAAFAEAAPGAILTGNLLGYGVASLNDQLVQGLKIAGEFA